VKTKLLQAERGWISNQPSQDTQDTKDYSNCGFASEAQPGQAYNEEAFSYFLALERKRSERSGRPFLLLLIEVVELMELRGSSVRVDSNIARKLFDALRPSLRETDFIGWYREGRVIGAVLTQPVRVPGADISRAIHQRIGESLQECLSPDVSSRLQVRVYQPPTTTVNRS
jgi:hypothetical protein